MNIATLTLICTTISLIIAIFALRQNNHMHASCGNITLLTHTRSIAWNLNSSEIDQVTIHYRMGHFTVGFLTLCSDGCPLCGEMTQNWDGRSLFYEIQDILHAPERYKVECYLKVKRDPEPWMPVPLVLNATL